MEEETLQIPYTEKIKRQKKLIKTMYSINPKKQAIKSFTLDKERSSPYLYGYILVDKFKEEDENYFIGEGCEWCVKNDGKAIFKYLDKFSPNIEFWGWEVVSREEAERELMVLNLNGDIDYD